MVLFDALFGIALGVVSVANYAGIFVLMVMESMVFPVPSEAVMPFAGFLVSSGQLGLLAVIAVSTLGSIVGSLIAYGIGFKGGRPFVEKYGRYFLLNKKHLDKAHSFFEKRGEITILVSRFIPVVRHLISIPAGSAKMNLGRFVLFTAIGAGAWNSILTYAGMALKDNWEAVMSYASWLDAAVIAVLVILIAYFVYAAKRKA
jgi:membrane protein DedA with SNARE-associated domain